MRTESTPPFPDGPLKAWTLQEEEDRALEELERSLEYLMSGLKPSNKAWTPQEERDRILEEIVHRDRDLDRIYYMEGIEFEQFIADFLRKQGYTVETTKGSGDQGVDLLLSTDNRRIAVQLKRHTRPVTNKAVQEVLTGRVLYKADEACVITTSSFTRGAVEAARGTGVRLIDGDELREWLVDLTEEENEQNDV